MNTYVKYNNYVKHTNTYQNKHIYTYTYINRYIIQLNGIHKMGGPPIFMEAAEGRLHYVGWCICLCKCMCFILICVGMFHIFLNIFDIFIYMFDMLIDISICLLICIYIYIWFRLVNFVATCSRCVGSFVHWFVGLVLRSSFVRSWMRAFPPSFVHSFICVCLFASLHACWVEKIQINTYIYTNKYKSYKII